MAANLPAEVPRLCIGPDGTPRPHVLEWLRTSASFRDVADMLEALDVHNSWAHARRHNADLAAAARKVTR